MIGATANRVLHGTVSQRRSFHHWRPLNTSVKGACMDTTALRERMVKNVFLNVELMLNDGVREISEYGLQRLMFLFFRRDLANTAANADREKNGKVECVV